jgi:hypothetical protein
LLKKRKARLWNKNQTEEYPEQSAIEMRIVVDIVAPTAALVVGIR